MDVSLIATTSDMTRTIPVSGRFTKRQRDVYDAVLSQNEATKHCSRCFTAHYVEVGEL